MESSVARRAGAASFPVTKSVVAANTPSMARRPAAVPGSRPRRQAGLSGLPPRTHLLGVPWSTEPVSGFQRIAASMRLASSKSRCVMPLLAWLRSLTQTFPGHLQVRMVPGRLGQEADGVDHREGRQPAVGVVLPADPASLVPPPRQLALEPLLDLLVGQYR